MPALSSMYSHAHSMPIGDFLCAMGIGILIALIIMVIIYFTDKGR